MLRNIYIKEGFAGIYAGLAPTLVMSVPNTVLYFTTYDELVSWLRRQESLRSSNNSWMPLVAGSSARLLASLATAPLELIRTRQAIAGASSSSGLSSVWGDLQRLVRHEGVAALFQGLAPTLWRDVPFSAIYWFSLEQFKLQWQLRYPNEHYKPAPLEQAGQAFINGAAAGMIAAACTTPFDVVKTRHQALGFSQSKSMMSAPAAAQPSTATVAVCHHNGATAVQQQKAVTNQNTILGTVRQVVAEEGAAGLWRGNATRIYKVAPACAIMISCYELGKVLLD
jgi:solute carrier family 25 protein 39/40